MTDARDAYIGAMVIGGCIFAVVCLVGLVMLAVAIGDELKRKPLRIRRAERLAAASVDAVLQVDLDEWEAEMLANVDAEWQRRWAPEPEPRETTMAPQPEPAAWPVPLSPRLTDRAEHYAAPQPLPPRAEVAVRLTDPHWATTAPTYNGDAAEWRSERVDGAPVVDEQTYAGTVLQNLSRNVGERTAALAMSQAFGHVVDAMPVSPAPQGRTRRAKGYNPGTDAQWLDPAFVSWEQPTGAFALVGVR